MRWRPVGVFFLLITLLLAGLLVSGYPTFSPKTNTIWNNLQVSVLMGEMNWLSTQLNRSGKIGYSVQGSLSVSVGDPFPPLFDFWVVNLTGKNLLDEKIHTGSTPAGFPPKNYTFIPEVAEVPNVHSFELHDLDYDGEYYFGFANNSTWNQNAQITLTETWQIKSPLLQPNPTNLLIITLTTITGLYLTIKNPRWPSKKPSKKRRGKKIRKY